MDFRGGEIPWCSKKKRSKKPDWGSPLHGREVRIQGLEVSEICVFTSEKMEVGVFCPLIFTLVGGFSPLEKYQLNGNVPQVGVKIKNISNHHLVQYFEKIPGGVGFLKY